MALDDISPENMRALIESAGDLTSEVNLDVLLQRILERAGALTNSPDTSIILKHVDRDSLYFAAATGDKSDWVLTTFGKYSAKDIPIEGSKAGRVFRSGTPILENKVEGHFAEVDKEARKITESMVCVPLVVGKRTLGVMQILNKREGQYTATDCELLQQLALQAAIGIRNAQLIEDLLAHSGFYSRFSGANEMQEFVSEFQRPATEELLTVLFADLRGFTQLIQSLGSPESVQTLLNEFVEMLTDIVLLREGIVNKFLGDGVMALFRGEAHSERAVRAAFQMLDRFGLMLEEWNDHSSEQLDFLDIGIGIVTDRVMLGAIGSEKVRDFTAIGSAVNLAAAFEQDARNGNRVLANHLAYREVAEFVEMKQLPDFTLKKPSQTVGITHKCYSLTALKPVVTEQIFISHNIADRERVQNDLVIPLNALGYRTWSAEDIKKGANWAEEIRNAISKSTWMLVIVSENSKGSDWIRTEVDMAVALGRHVGKIVPVAFDDTPLRAINEYLVTMQAFDVRAEEKIADAIAKLIREQCSVA